jgi:hypothetical protein
MGIGRSAGASEHWRRCAERAIICDVLGGWRGHRGKPYAAGAGRLLPAWLHVERLADAQDAIAKPPNGTCPWHWIASGSYCLRSGNVRR